MSVETYKCTSCGAQMGIAGESSGSPEDLAADEYFDDEVRRHESGRCINWQPRDVAMVECGDGQEREATYRFDSTRGPYWQFRDGALRDADVSSARPALVLDPENAETADRFARDLLRCGVMSQIAPLSFERLSEAVQAAMREQLRTPRLPEPMHPGAVVEDVDGRIHVRTPHDDGRPWVGADGKWRSWHQIDAARELAGGVAVAS